MPHIRLPNGLTPIQQNIVKEITTKISQGERVNMTQVGLKTFNTTNPDSARVMASQELHKPLIQESIQEVLNRNGITLDKVTQNIAFLANSTPEKVSAETMLKANVEYLKLFNAYPDKKSYQFSLSMKGQVKDLGYSEAKKQLDELNAQLGTLEAEETKVIEEPDV